jgi:ribulose-phosphate 3-epimerase
MTVNPGWGGQKFIGSSVGKIGRIAGLLGDGVALEVDGGIDVETAGQCARAGATLFVAGSAVFGAADPAAAYVALADVVAGSELHH